MMESVCTVSGVESYISMPFMDKLTVRDENNFAIPVSNISTSATGNFNQFCQI
jgi:hypothetical protein